MTSTGTSLFDACSLFDGLSDEARRAFLDRCEYRYFPIEEAILQKGAPCPGLFLISQGSVEIVTIDQSGNHVILYNAGPGSLLGDVESQAGAPILADCIARAGTEAYFIDAQAYFDALSDPDLRRNQARINYDRLSFANQTHLLCLTRSVEVQIGACLLQLAMEGKVISHSQAYVADMVGCSRQTANRILGEMKDKGWLSLRKGVIELHSPDDIRRMID